MHPKHNREEEGTGTKISNRQVDGGNNETGVRLKGWIERKKHTMVRGNGVR